MLPVPSVIGLVPAPNTARPSRPANVLKKEESTLDSSLSLPCGNGLFLVRGRTDPGKTELNPHHTHFLILSADLIKSSPACSIHEGFLEFRSLDHHEARERTIFGRIASQACTL